MSDEFLSQFGDQLVNPSSDRSAVAPSDALAGKEAVSAFVDDRNVIELNVSEFDTRTCELEKS